jgi:hypothetical protein
VGLSFHDAQPFHFAAVPAPVHAGGFFWRFLAIDLIQLQLLASTFEPSLGAPRSSNSKPMTPPQCGTNYL